MDDRVRLSDSEWKIMEKLWENQPATIAELTALLRKETGWQKSTVITLLKRMEKKGAVTYTQGERAKQFFAALRRRDAVLDETRSFLNRTYRGSVGSMLKELIRSGAIGQKELDELRRILQEGEKGK